MATTKRSGFRCGVCGKRAWAVSLHPHTLAAALRGSKGGPADLQWNHDGFQHVIAGGSALPKFRRLVAELEAGRGAP